MPLPSVLKHGAKQCSAKSKRTSLPCNNPAAHGCKTCRMHGAHKSRNVANGAKSGKYTNGHHTKEAKEKSSKSLVRLRYLEELVYDKEMLVTWDKKDKYYRILGKVILVKLQKGGEVISSIVKSFFILNNTHEI